MGFHGGLAAFIAEVIGKFLPAGSVPVTVVEQTIGGGTLPARDVRVAVFPGDAPVFAVREEGIDWPWVYWTADPFDGIYFGDGTQDPYDFATMCGNLFTGGGSLFLDGPGTGLRSELGMGPDSAQLDLAPGDGATDVRVTIGSYQNDARGAFIRLRSDPAQTGDLIDAFGTAAFVVTAAAGVIAGLYATADRPAGQGTGTQIFDQDLMIPIWSDGAGGWLNALGAPA